MQIFSKTTQTLTVLAIAGSLVCSAAHAATFTVTDLGTLGGTVSEATGINTYGQVVGDSAIAGTTPTHGFVNNHGVMTNLGVLGGTFSYAKGINTAGYIVGKTQVVGTDTHLYEHAFAYHDSHMIDLGTLDGPNHASIANAINTAGTIVGGTSSGGHYRAFSAIGTAMMDLGSLNGTDSVAYAINTGGTVVGVSKAGDAIYHAFVFNGHTMADLGTLGGTFSSAQGINDAGYIVGGSSLASGDQHAFVYSTSNGMHDLGTLGGHFSTANAINTAGSIVGASATSLTSTDTKAFLYRESHMTDLNTLIPTDSGWVLRTALAINTSGQIVGQGLHNGVLHAFLLSPITTVVLTAPTSVVATPVTSTRINLTWHAGSGAVKYYIYRSTATNTTHTYIGQTTSTSFVSTGLTPHTTYYYIVSSVGSTGVEAKSPEVHATTLSLPGAVTNIKATVASKSLLYVTWTAAEGATNYLVYRLATGGVKSYLGSVTTPYYRDATVLPATTYTYFIVSSNTYGSGPGVEVKATTPAN